MKTLKPYLKQENIDSNIRTIFTNYSKRDCVKIALYCAEDCFHLNPIKQSQLCIDLIKKWLTDETSVTKKELRIAADAADATANLAAEAAYWAANAADAAATVTVVATAAANPAANAAYAAAYSFGIGKNGESKLQEYRNYALLFAYEDLSFPYRKEARTFNLDNETDLNIFLDFLTDHYPEAITYDREEYFTNKLAKEYLKVIYQ